VSLRRRSSFSNVVIAMPLVQSGKIKVLTMLTSFQIGGTERQVTNVSLGLDAARFDLHLACMRNFGELMQELEDASRIHRPVFDIGSLYSFRTLREATKLARYIRRNAIQIVHTYGLYPNIFAVPVARFAGARIVIASIRDCCDILKPWQRWLQRIVCRLADCVLVNADAVRESLISQGYRSDNIAVIRNAIAQPRATNTEEHRSIREELGLNPSVPVVMVLSRLNRMKGVQYFLDAARMVAGRLPDARFLIVGDGAIRQELETLAIGLGLADKIVFTGFRTDVPRLLSQVNLSVLPSLSEGLSNTLLESMAAGVPVVATSVGGNPEIIEDGVSGLLVPPRDSAKLADAMITLLKNPALASSFGAAGKLRIAEVFSLERSVREIEHLYQKLIEGPGCSTLEATAL
jgi:glycosyltransferase involved in cell wall biosynthesis